MFFAPAMNFSNFIKLPAVTKDNGGLMTPPVNVATSGNCISDSLTGEAPGKELVNGIGWGGTSSGWSCGWDIVSDAWGCVWDVCVVGVTSVWSVLSAGWGWVWTKKSETSDADRSVY